MFRTLHIFIKRTVKRVTKNSGEFFLVLFLVAFFSSFSTLLIARVTGLLNGSKGEQGPKGEKGSPGGGGDKIGGGFDSSEELFEQIFSSPSSAFYQDNFFAFGDEFVFFGKVTNQQELERVFFEEHVQDAFEGHTFIYFPYSVNAIKGSLEFDRVTDADDEISVVGLTFGLKISSKVDWGRKKHSDYVGEVKFPNYKFTVSKPKKRRFFTYDVNKNMPTPHQRFFRRTQFGFDGESTQSSDSVRTYAFEKGPNASEKKVSGFDFLPVWDERPPTRFLNQFEFEIFKFYDSDRKKMSFEFRPFPTQNGNPVFEGFDQHAASARRPITADGCTAPGTDSCTGFRIRLLSDDIIVSDVEPFGTEIHTKNSTGEDVFGFDLKGFFVYGLNL